MLSGRKSSTFNTERSRLRIVHCDTKAPALPCARAVPSGPVRPAARLPPSSWFISSVKVPPWRSSPSSSPSSSSSSLPQRLSSSSNGPEPVLVHTQSVGHADHEIGRHAIGLGVHRIANRQDRFHDHARGAGNQVRNLRPAWDPGLQGPLLHRWGTGGSRASGERRMVRLEIFIGTSLS